MDVKIDTKEKFTVLTPNPAEMPANMTVEFQELLLSNAEKQPPHLILNLKNVTHIDPEIAQKITEVQQKFYEKDISFVVCEMQPAVEQLFDERGLLEIMNVTPTESEAWDIVQMEEIERELMGDFDDEKG